MDDQFVDDIIEQAQNNAYERALEGVSQERQEENVSGSLKRKKGVCEPARKDIRRSRKHRLRTVEHYLCDHCDSEIKKPEEGFVIHGNIYVADPNKIGGLVGDNFPEEETMTKDQVTKTVMCRSCFMRALGLFKPSGFRDDNKREPYNEIDQVANQLQRVPRRAIH